MTPGLSERCHRWLNTSYGLLEGMQRAMENPFDLQMNSNGIINLGVAENMRMFDLLEEKVASSRFNQLEPWDIRYNDFLGMEKLRSSCARFLNEKLDIPKAARLSKEEIAFANGCGSSVESLFHVLCDSDDVIIIPGPYYGGFDIDVERRARVQIAVADSEPFGHDLTAECLELGWERAFHLARESGTKVRALLIMNPVNPSGHIYNSEIISNAIEFCMDKGIHLVVDEIYALSLFNDKKSEFKSVFCHPKYLEHKEMIHFLWGFSKDFCVNGFRAGVMVSKNAMVVKGMGQLAYFTGISTLMQKLLSDFLSDSNWNTRFLDANVKRLGESYDYCKERIEEFNTQNENMPTISYLPAKGGFFVWVDFSAFLNYDPDVEKGAKRERQLFLDFIDIGKIYIAPGHMAFHSTIPGTFRIIFAAEREILSRAFDGIFHVLRLTHQKYRE